MKITETRKAIIELIEPFMDKTGYNGLIVKLDWTKECYINGEFVGGEGQYYRVGDRLEVTRADIYEYDCCYGCGGKGVRNSHALRFKIHTKSNRKTDEDGVGIRRPKYIRVNKTRTFGHYDITAVLKFIKSNGNFTIEFYENGIGIVGKEDYFIQNKPLHLYTEEEDKQLLEILTNLVR